MSINSISQNFNFFEEESGETASLSNGLNDLSEELLFETETERLTNLKKDTMDRLKKLAGISLEDEPENDTAEGMQLFMGAYLRLHPDAHFFKQGEDTLSVVDGEKRILVHFDNKGNVEYMETMDENNDYELSEGKYGKTRNEAIEKIATLYKEHGIASQVLSNIVVVNKDDYQLQYKVEGNGVVRNVKRTRNPKEFLGTETPKNINTESNNNKKPLL